MGTRARRPVSAGGRYPYLHLLHSAPPLTVWAKPGRARLPGRVSGANPPPTPLARKPESCPWALSIEMIEAVAEAYWPAYSATGSGRATWWPCRRSRSTTGCFPGAAGERISCRGTSFRATRLHAAAPCSTKLRPQASPRSGKKPSPTATCAPSALGPAGSTRAGAGLRPSGSTTGSGACGTSISPRARPGAGPEPPTWCRSRGAVAVDHHPAAARFAPAPGRRFRSRARTTVAGRPVRRAGPRVRTGRLT